MKSPLAPPPGRYDLVNNSIADIAYGISAFIPDKHAFLSAIAAPFRLNGAEAAYAGLANGCAEQEFDDTIPLAAFTLAPIAYQSSGPLAEPEDLKGLKIRSGGTGSGILQKLGASPSDLSPWYTNEAIRRGTMDATEFP